uniref:Vav guanine nucleotide exchange factor 1 n=1 Tax=Lynx canadensis TaxID=61383 RepID=A0A667ING7_LYNCA
MELWRQCTHWLIQCRVLPPGHRVTWDGAQVCELAQALRDGVLLCQLLNNLLPHAINLREVNLRPQMSQFLCLKNIRTFLSTCCEKFGLKRSELFEAFDLFDVQDFGKVIYTLSALSWTPIAQNKGIMPLAHPSCGLSDQIDDTVERMMDLYDCVDNEEAEVMRSTRPHSIDKRCCCLREIQQTEEKYTDTLGIHPTVPCNGSLKPQDIEIIFINTSPHSFLLVDLLRVHTLFLKEMKEVLGTPGAPTLYQVFIKYKERFLVYGRYCSQVESASTGTGTWGRRPGGCAMKLEASKQRRFTLRDLLMVPMQRVLKYHLLLQVHKWGSPLPHPQDLAQCVNEVKRDNETCTADHQLPAGQSLAHYGRPKIDGELKITSVERIALRYAFLLDKALLICKVRDDSSGERETEGGWTHMFLLIEDQGSQGYELFFKTRELKKKWLEQFEMAISNIYPENATANGHDFQMFSFEETTSCKACQMLLRGTFYQGYRCHRCRAPAHKECLGRVPPCGRHGFAVSLQDKPHRRPQDKKRNDLGLPKMEVCQEYYGLPPPPGAIGPFLRLNPGDIVELTKAEAEQNWWEGPCGPLSLMYPDRYAGPMERAGAESILTNRSDGTFLVRQRVKDSAEFAISIKYNVEVKHIKIMTAEGLYRITEKKAFRGLTELVEFYQQNSLKDCFKSLDTCLQFPFKEPERRAISKPPAGSTKYFGTAKARYDFCARDRSELSLKEGDIIKILNKKGQQGWWRGEIYGRVSWGESCLLRVEHSSGC